MSPRQEAETVLGKRHPFVTLLCYIFLPILRDPYISSRCTRSPLFSGSPFFLPRSVVQHVLPSSPSPFPLLVFPLPIAMDFVNPPAFLSASWITHNIGPVLIALLSLYPISRAIYQLFFSPLSSIPGPWYAAISHLWITTHVLRLQQCKTIHKLFKKYGPVVRIAPNKVIFNDLTSMRTVYVSHKFNKSPFYKSLLTWVLFYYIPFGSLISVPAMRTIMRMRPFPNFGAHTD